MANNRAASWLALKISGSFRHGIHLLPKEDAQSDSCGNKKNNWHLARSWFSHILATWGLNIVTLKFISLPHAGTLEQHECSLPCLQGSQWKQRLGWILMRWCLQPTACFAWQGFWNPLILSRNIPRNLKQTSGCFDQPCLWSNATAAFFDLNLRRPHGISIPFGQIITQNFSSQIGESFLQVKPMLYTSRIASFSTMLVFFFMKYSGFPRSEIMCHFFGNQMKTLHTSDCDSSTKIIRMHSSGSGIPP